MLALPFGFIAMASRLPDCWRHGDADRFEDLAADALALASDHETPIAFFDGHLLQCFQVLLDVRPLEVMAGRLKTPIQLLAHHQCKEAAEDMATDGLIPLMEDRPRLQQGFNVSENSLHPPQLLVLEGYLGGIQVGMVSAPICRQSGPRTSLCLVNAGAVFSMVTYFR